MSGFCEIKVKLGKSDEIIFHSDMELDSFLKEQAPKLESWYKLSDGNLDKIFSLEGGISFSQTQDETLTRIEDVTRTFKNAEKVTVTVKPRRIGSTTLSKYLSLKVLVILSLSIL